MREDASDREEPRAQRGTGSVASEEAGSVWPAPT